MRLLPALALAILATPAFAGAAPPMHFQKTTIGPVTFLAALRAAWAPKPAPHSADIVMTSGGPGPNSTPFLFGVENLDLDAMLKSIMHGKAPAP